MTVNKSLNNLLQDFWSWAGISEMEYANLPNASQIVEPFYFPEFITLREKCFGLINTDMNIKEFNDFLTCLALDEEEEIILDWCKDIATPCFLTQLSQIGCSHLQADARWQIAELLRCRSIPKRCSVLQHLCKDTNAYVRKRAQNAIRYLSET